MKQLTSQKLPDFLRPLFWSYRFEQLDAERHKQRIIINIINYGSWRAWQWLVSTYGKNELKQTISNLPRSEFRPGALRLIATLLDFDISQMQRVRSIN